MSKLSRGLLLLVILADVRSAVGQPVADHLECYKIKDPQATTTYTAELEGLTPEPGCVIKVPAKLACVPTQKTITSSPPPPGGGAGGIPNQFLCYSVKCPKGTPPALSVEDQFGARTVQPIKSKMLCAPALDPNATTTTTSQCPPGQTPCELDCVDAQNDPANCGGCNVVCSAPNATSGCVTGQCTIAACDAGFSDCNDIVGDGCEADLQSDELNCGICGTDCDAQCTGNVTSTACSAGTCTVTSCAANRYDVDGICGTGCECTGVTSGGSSCGASVVVGTINPGGNVLMQGNLPAGGQQWYQVTFTAGGTPSLSFNSNPGGVYRFDVFSNCSSSVCFNSTSCNPGPGTFQVGVKTTASTCSNFALRFQN